MKRFSTFALVALLLNACSSASTTSPTANPSFILTSGAFEDGQAIPEPFTCKGTDISPALSWVGTPSGTLSLALTLDDPDARGFVHWLVWNIHPDTTQLTEDNLPEGVVLGKTSFNKLGYGGPCPPSGTHHYSFKLYALDTTLTLDEGSTMKELQAAMEGHILAETELVGTFTPG